MNGSRRRGVQYTAVMPMAISGFSRRYRIFARTEPCERRTATLVVSRNVLWVYLLLLRGGKSADHGRIAPSFTFTGGRTRVPGIYSQQRRRDSLNNKNPAAKISQTALRKIGFARISQSFSSIPIVENFATHF